MTALRLVPPKPPKKRSRQAAWEAKRARTTKRCVRCGKKRTVLKWYCLPCSDIRNTRRRQRYKALKGKLRKMRLLK